MKRSSCPGRYPAGFRRKVLDLVEAGRPIVEIAKQLGASGQTIYNWRNQDRVDRGLRPGVPTAESAELAAARRRISELETNSGLRTPQALAQPSPTPVGGTAGRAVRWLGSEV